MKDIFDKAKPDIVLVHGVTTTALSDEATTNPITIGGKSVTAKSGDVAIYSKKEFVFYGNLRHETESVVHMGDNLTGAGDGDDEQICVDLNGVPQDVDKIVFDVNIFAARERMQHFGMIQNAFIRLVNADNNSELYRYNLSENYSGLTAMIFGEVYRHNGEWKFSALGQGTNDMSITEVSQRYQ